MSNVPFDVQDPIEIGDLSDQELGDVMDAARGIAVEIESVKLKVTKDKETGVVKFTQLDPVFVITNGIDDEGRYQGRKLFGWQIDFPGILISFDKTRYIEENAKQTSVDWWKKKARAITKQFFTAIGEDVSNLPSITEEYLGDLAGKELRLDVTKVDKKDYDGNKTGEMVNKIKNFKSI